LNAPTAKPKLALSGPHGTYRLVSVNYFRLHVTFGRGDASNCNWRLGERGAKCQGDGYRNAIEGDSIDLGLLCGDLDSGAMNIAIT
jgi:hypothetical protein